MSDLETDRAAQNQEILRRLRRIEGQVRGLQRMVDEDRGCREIVTQIAAARQALSGVSQLLVTRYAQTCLENPLTTRDEMINDLITLLRESR
jgi:CsoR family transcriptional regulator, copper-sensing transcriptional repressor